MAMMGMVVLGTRAVLAQPPAEGQGGSLEPPKFQPAPVPAKVAEAVAKSADTVDPFDPQAPSGGGVSAPAAPTTPTSTAGAAAPAPIRPPSVPAPTPPSSAPPGPTAPTATSPTTGSTTAPSAISPSTPTTPTPSTPTTPTPTTPAAPLTAPDAGARSITPVPTTPALPGPSAPPPSGTTVSPSSPGPATALPPSSTSLLPADMQGVPGMAAPSGPPLAEGRRKAKDSGRAAAPVGRGVSQYEDVQPTPQASLAARAPAPSDRAAGPGFALQVGGGLMNFGSSRMQELTQTGGYWDARMLLGLRRVVGLELAYVGTMNPVIAPDMGPSASLVGHGAEGDLRINIPVIGAEGSYVVPYALAGLGWQHLQLRNADARGTALAPSDDVVTIPVGGGVTLGHGHLYLDARFTYRFTQDEDLLATNNGGSNQLGQWTFGGNFGYLF
jgi:hypothetical protein